MLYIDCHVNKRPIQAFVDSGAQATIISQRCAHECGIMHLLDVRFKGKALGVGSANILGRIHLADMEVGGQILQCSFTVLEDNKVDLLFGLDNLKRHQCCIDLVQSKLHFRNGEFSVSFLSDGEIKKTMADEMASPKLDGKFDEKMVDELIQITGKSKVEVQEALAINDGNKEHALNFLMSSDSPGIRS